MIYEGVMRVSERILIIDDEREIADLIELYLKNENYEVFKFYSALGALDSVNSTEFDLRRGRLYHKAI